MDCSCYFFSVLPLPQFFLCITSENCMHRNYGVLVGTQISVNFHVRFSTIFCYFSTTDLWDTLNLAVAGAAINIWQRILLKESLYCVMTKLKTAQMEKIKVAWVTFRHFLSVPCSALQTCCLFILILHLYVHKLQNFKTANRAISWSERSCHRSQR